VTVRVVPGEIAAKDTTARVVLPTSLQAKIPPIERVAETIASPARKLPLHKHEAAEVLTYVVEGSGTYEFAGAPIASIGTGDARIMTAPGTGSHAINPGKGQTIRSFAVVASLSPSPGAPAKLQSSSVIESPPQADGSAVARLLGPGAPLKSLAGLECEVVRFVGLGTSFRRVGHDRTGICYALAGRGSVDGVPLEGGEAAIITDAAGIALQGREGFRAILLRAPGSSRPVVSGPAAPPTT
jgi:redox-sensitive bicupin YhaK (pirin superfamily)